MQPDGKRPAVRDVLEEALSDDPEIAFAVAFGSRTTGRARTSSDLDITVKFDGDLSPRQRFRKLCSLSGSLQGEDRPHMDVSDVERLPLAVAHDAVSGELICGDKALFDRYRDTVEEQYDSERDDLRERNRDVIDRVAEKGLRG